MKDPHRYRQRRAVALLMVLVTVASISVLAITFISGQSTSLGIARNVNRHGRARAIAETGLEMTLYEIRNNSTWRIDHTNKAWVSDEPFDGGTFSIVGEDGEDTDGNGTVDGDGDISDDAADPLTLTATATFDGVMHTVRAVVRPALGTVVRSGAVGSNKAMLKRRAIVDSFDSAVGPYGGSNIGQDAVIATNSTSANQVQVHNFSTVNGDVYVGVGTTPEEIIKVVGANAVITGTIDVLTNPVPMPTVTEPPGLPPNVGNVSYSGATLLSADLHCDQLTVSNGVVSVSGDVTIVARGPVTFGTNAQVELLPGSTLTVYHESTLDFIDNARVNLTAAKPSLMQFLNLGSDAVIMRDQVQAYARIVGPSSVLDLRDDAHFMGTFLGDDLRMTDDARFSQDTSKDGGAVPVSNDTDYAVIWTDQP